MAKPASSVESPQSNLMDSPLGEPWTQFSEKLASSNDRLITELEGCWLDLRQILKDQLRQLEALSLPPLEPSVLEHFQQVRQELGQKMLNDPLAQWDRKRPYQRAEISLERYDRSLGDLIRTLPTNISLNGAQTLAVLDPWIPSGLLRRIAPLRRKERLLALESLVAAALGKLAAARSRIEGEYLLVLLLACRQLKKNWELARALLDASLEAAPTQSKLAAQREVAEAATKEVVRQAEAALEGWRQWHALSLHGFARAILSVVVWRRANRLPATDGRATALAHWAEQLRSVETEVKLEQTLERSERQILNVFHAGLKGAEGELAGLREELENFIDWLRHRIEGSGDEDLPPPKGGVIPALSRLSELVSGLKLELRALPQTCDALAALSALPKRRSRSRQLRPRQTLDQAFHRSGYGKIRRVLEEVELQHRKIVQQIERAREVVSFGMGSDETERDPDPQVTQEALKNAQSLLEFQRAEIPDWQSSASGQTASALAGVFIETRLILRQVRLGAFAYLAQQGLRRALMIGAEDAVTRTVRVLQRAYKVTERGALEFLIYIGWRQAPTAGKAEVTTRVFLPQEFVADLSVKELPAIYRRLFRFEAVQDPRFLVGRDRELAAVAEARSFWEAGRPVALMIVGERGSGKTSLINCALEKNLQGLEVIRGEFKDRLTSESELTGFLMSLMEVAEPTQLLQFFSERRRVVILEELERTFLRQVGCYAALRALQRFIAATCSSTLWILVVNQVAFKFLNATVRLGESFSHRLDAASASRDALRQAIMLRHNLSGLRLQFALPPSHHPFRERVKALFQGQADPEAIFFNTLAKESAGVFRTAFNIWLGQIERVESGLLYMKPLVSPDLSPLISALDITDLFTLVAILQHGSLTPEEHARIFQKSVMTSRSQIDGLVAREIIEPDPGRPGFRVRPEALRVVHEALYRRNLL